MLDLQNQTPFDAALLPGLDKEGRDTLTVAVKATFTLDRRGNVAVADAQLPLQRGDVHTGEPGASSVQLEDESTPVKRGTDIVLVGHAWAGPRKSPSVDVTLRVGRLARSARVFGDRAWYRGATGIAPSDPVPFSRMPLVWERAFGGKDAAAEGAFDARNPVGVGYTSAVEAERIEGVRLPNIEDLGAPIASPADRPQPFGFGFVGRHWAPRVALAGTYDDAWRDGRAPLLPLDFDDRFFNGAPLVAAKHLEGGEPVHLVGVAESGELRFQLPTATLGVAMSVRGAVREPALKLDTVVLQPDERRVVMIWRATEACPRALVHVDWVRVRDRRPS